MWVGVLSRLLKRLNWRCFTSIINLILFWNIFIIQALPFRFFKLIFPFFMVC